METLTMTAINEFYFLGQILNFITDTIDGDYRSLHEEVRGIVNDFTKEEVDDICEDKALGTLANILRGCHKNYSEVLSVIEILMIFRKEYLTSTLVIKNAVIEKVQKSLKNDTLFYSVVEEISSIIKQKNLEKYYELIKKDFKK